MIGQIASKVRAHVGVRRTIAMIAIACAFAVSPRYAKANDAPELLLFNAVHIFDDWWMFYGEFEDEAPEYCIIDFGGILDGHSTMGDADGTFSYVIEVPSTAFGIVSAQVLDPRDQWSNVLEDVVDP